MLVLINLAVDQVMINPAGYVPVAYIPVYNGGYMPVVAIPQMQAPAIPNNSYMAPVIPQNSMGYAPQQGYQNPMGYVPQQPTNYSQGRVNNYQPFHTQDVVGRDLSPYADRLLEIDKQLANLQEDKKGSKGHSINSTVRFRNTVLLGAVANELLNKDNNSKGTARKVLGGALLLQKPLGKLYDKTVGKVSRATVEPLLGNTVGKIFE